MKMQYDYLTKLPTNAELAAFRKEAPKVAGGITTMQYILLVVLGSGFGLPFAFLFGGRNAVLLGIFIPLFSIIGGVGLAYLCYLIYKTHTLRRRYRLYYFAKENNLEYTPGLKRSDAEFMFAERREDTAIPSIQTGMVFAAGGHSERIEDRLVRPGEFEISNYYYTTGSGKNQQRHDWGYIRVPLKRRLPHIVLDAKKNNTGLFGFSITNLPLTFKKDQTLSLEGDFDTYFTLYAPKKYERDALYIFTPDLMALLIDESAQFDVEIIDDALYVYSSRPFMMQDPAVLNRLFAIIDAIGNKMTKATERYADERVVNAREANIVAPAGARLKQGFPLIGIIVIIYILWSIITSLF